MDRELPKEEWKDALLGFTSEHKGWLARVREVNGGLGPRYTGDYAPLAAVACEERGGEVVVDIVVEPIDDAPNTHIVADPVELHIREVEGADMALEIVSRDGTQTLVEFRSTLPD
jgi:hypothetical protein